MARVTVLVSEVHGVPQVMSAEQDPSLLLLNPGPHGLHSGLIGLLPTFGAGTCGEGNAAPGDGWAGPGQGARPWGG